MMSRCSSGMGAAGAAFGATPGRVSFAPLAWLGRLSYSLYLWKQPYAPEVPGVQPAWFREYPQCLFLAGIMALFSYYLVERPLLRLRSSFRTTSKAGSENALPPLPGTPRSSKQSHSDPVPREQAARSLDHARL